MTEALKPCPFCGAKDGRLEQAFTRATDDFAYWSVECLDCACEIASDASQAEADEAWNTRALPSPATDAGEVRKGWMVCPDCHGDSVHWPISQPGCQACSNDGGWENADEAPASEPSPTFADGIEAAAKVAESFYLKTHEMIGDVPAGIAAAIRGLAR